MSAEQIVYGVILAWLATILGLGLGWSRAHIRANKAEQREGVLTAVVDAKNDTIEALETQVDVLGQSCDNLATRLIGANVRLAKSRRVNDENVRLIAPAKTVIERRAWLPTVEGIRADSLDAFGLDMPIGVSLGWNADETPIGASVVESLAEVVPIGGAR